jgi:hypothetical protein
MSAAGAILGDLGPFDGGGQPMASATATRRDVLRYRLHRHQLDREPGTAAGPGDVELLDVGVQDTGTDGAAWALAVRGIPAFDPKELALAWTLRGAPHAYRRTDLDAVAVATAPLSEADAAKRIFDAAKPLKAAGIPVLDALRIVAGHLREIVAKPTVKGDASSRLTELVDQPYLRACRPCAATHVYEMPFRLAALQAGLELDPGTSPPVLRRVPRLRPLLFGQLAGGAEPQLDVVRGYLRFYGPARVADATTFLDAAAKDVKAAWPDDAVEVTVDDDAGSQPRFVLAEDLDALTGGGAASRTVRLVGPYDPYLQLRDRDLLVTDEACRRDLWRVLGRPGAIVADGEVIGTWRPKASGRKLTVRVEPWTSWSSVHRTLIEEQADRLAAHRNVALAAVTEE